MITVENPKASKIRTESGVWIPASYKTQRYSQWKQKNKIENAYGADDNDDSDNEASSSTQKCKRFFLLLFLAIPLISFIIFLPSCTHGW